MSKATEEQHDWHDSFYRKTSSCRNTYIITPTYDSLEELDEAVQKLHRECMLRGYKDLRMPQRVFLKVLGMKQPVNSSEYANDVLLDTGERHMVPQKNGKPRYYYMKYSCSYVPGRPMEFIGDTYYQLDSAGKSKQFGFGSRV